MDSDTHPGIDRPQGSASGLAYCPNLPETLRRLTALYERRAPDAVFAVMHPPSPALERFRREHEAGYCDFPDLHERAVFWDRLLAERAAIPDDSVPAAYLTECDQGLYGGVVGGTVQYMVDPATGWISSMVAPILKDGGSLSSLGFQEEGSIYRRYREQLRVFAAAANTKFGLSHFIMIDNLNFAYELYGATRTYEFMLQDPERLHEVRRFAHPINVRLQRDFFEAAPSIGGGTCSNMLQWVPGRVVSESVDPFHMTSIDDFEKWGRDAVCQVFEEFDGGVIHIHGNGRHLLASVASIPGLKAIWLGDDQGFPPAFEALPGIQEQTGNVPLVVTCPYTGFRRAFEQDRLPGGCLYNVLGVPSRDEAATLMDRIRKQRPFPD